MVHSFLRSCSMAAALVWVLGTSAVAQKKLAFDIQKNDVGAMGFGNAYVANGYNFNGMLYNPALLERAKFGLEIANVGFFLGANIFSAAKQIKDNQAKFKSAPKTISDAKKAIDKFERDPNPVNGRKANRAVSKMNALSKTISGVTNDLQTDPVSFGVFPASMFKMNLFGNHIGIAAYANTNIVLKPRLGSTLNNFANLKADTVSAGNSAQLKAALNPTDPTEAYPKAQAFGVLDIVVAAGLARAITDQITVGANVKYVQRRSVTENLDPAEFNNPTKTIQKDIKNPLNKIGIDVGGIYKLNEKTTVGMVIQDLVATSKDAKGVDGTLRGRILELPVQRNVNVGANHKISDNFDVNAEFDDLLNDSKLYESGLDHARVGAEYRLKLLFLTLPVRAGLGQGAFTAGTGLYIGRLIRLDYAYAKSTAVETFYQHNLQLRVALQF